MLPRPWRAAIRFHPSRLGPYLRLAGLLTARSKPRWAAMLYRHILTLAPKMPAALIGLGRAHLAAHLTVSTLWITECLASNSQVTSLRGAALHRQGRLDAAQSAFCEALNHSPEQAIHHRNLAALLDDLGQPKDALYHYQHALALNPRDHHATLGQGLALLALGSFKKGLAIYESRRLQPSFPCQTIPSWDGTELPGSLLIFSEQGLGDCIYFLRFLPAVFEKVGYVILQVPTILTRLLMTAPIFHQEGGRVTVSAQTPRQANASTPLASLPHQLSLDPLGWGSKPYLRAPPTTPSMTTILTSLKRPYIGLVWAGNPSYPGDFMRSVSLAELRPLAETLQGRASFLALQKGPARMQLAEAMNWPGNSLHDVAPALEDMADTAALIERIDLLISVDTAPAHVAGALGQSVWILLPYGADWRWGAHNSRARCYPSARLFRAPYPGAMHKAIQVMAQALADAFSNRLLITDKSREGTTSYDITA